MCYEGPTQPVAAWQITHFHQKFPLGQEIPGPNQINLVTLQQIKRSLPGEYTVSESLQPKNQHHQVPESWNWWQRINDFFTTISKYMCKAQCQLQQCIKKINQWATKNVLKVSKTKTRLLQFCQLRKMHNDFTYTSLTEQKFQLSITSNSSV